MTTGFILNLSTQLDSLFTAFAQDGYQALANTLRAPLGAMLALYITLMGYATLRGLIQTQHQALLTFTLRAGLIYTLAMDWGNFSYYVVELFTTTSDTLSHALMHAVNKKSLPGTLNQGLQQALDEVVQLGADTMAQASFRHLAPYYASILIYLSGVTTISIAFMEVTVAKLMIALSFSTAPLFILFTLFEQTKAFFERWLGVLVGSSFVLIFVSSVLGFCLNLMHWTMQTISSSQLPSNVSVWVPLFIVSCLCIMTMLQAASMGRSIGGAFCASGGAAFAGQMLGRFMAPARAATRLAKRGSAEVYQAARGQA